MNAWQCDHVQTCETCGHVEKCGRWNWTNQMRCQSCGHSKPDHPIYELHYCEGFNLYLTNNSGSFEGFTAGRVHELVESR